MDKIPAGKPLRDFIKLCYAADLPPLVCGAHGIGKSELIEQTAAELGIGFICRDLSLMEPPDLIGLPKATGKTTSYLPPSFLPRGGKGLLVFEELNRCERYMRAPCLQLLTARKLNDYCLPPGWLPVAAINPPDQDYDVNELDPALLSRFAFAEVVADRGEWLEWARRHGLHPGVIRYVESDESVFDHPDNNPRAWRYVSDVLKVAEKESTPIETVRLAVLGLVEQKRGTAFLRTLQQSEQPLMPADILKSYVRHRRDLQHWVKNGRLDLVKGSLRAILTHLQPKRTYQEALAERKSWKNLAAFLRDLPGDLQETAKAFFADRKYKYPAQSA